MGDISHVNELSIDAGFTYDPDNDKMTVKNKVGLYQESGLHTITDQMAGTDALQLSVQVQGDESIGSPIITGVGVRDTCVGDHPGLNLHGILAVTDPSGAAAAVKIQGYKQSGTGVTALADDEPVLQVVDNNNSGIKFWGNGDIATSQWYLYDDAEVVGWSSLETAELYLKLVGKTMFVTFYFRGTSNSDTASFTLPYAAKSSYYNLGFSLNLDNSTNYIGTIYSSNGTVTINRQFTNGEWTDSGTKDVRGSFFFEIDQLP